MAERDWVAIGAANRAKGICPTCRTRKAKRGRTCCQICIDSAVARRRRWRYDGLCVDCREKTEGGTRRCKACQGAHQEYKNSRNA